jgi:hypothetical protein
MLCIDRYLQQTRVLDGYFDVVFLVALAYISRIRTEADKNPFPVTTYLRTYLREIPRSKK